MRRFSVIPEVATPNSDSKKAYTQLYEEKLDASHFEAMRDLLPALRSSSAMGITAERCAVPPPIERMSLGLF